MTPLPQVTDSYCEVYLKLIREKGDAEIKAKPEVKKRILVNERTYAKCP